MVTLIMSDEKPQTVKKNNLMHFFTEVRSEARKVTWATRGETVTSSIMVFIMVIIAATFFYFADVILKSGVGVLLSLAGSFGN